jgi:hypothetical protein
MTNKTPYEIRLEVLKMAQEVEMQHYYANRDRIHNNWQVQVESARAKGDVPPECPAFPEFPTEQAIVRKAELLSEYINNKTKPLV